MQQRHETRPDPTRALLARLADGDREAWAELVTQYSPLLMAVAAKVFSGYGQPPRPQDVEDAVADVWKNLLENKQRILRECELKGNFLQVVHVLARHRAIDILRKRRGRRLVSLEGNAPVAAPEVGDVTATAELVAAATLGLQERERTLVQLFFLQGKKYREIAKLTGIPQNSIGPTLARAMNKMRKALGAELELAFAIDVEVRVGTGEDGRQNHRPGQPRSSQPCPGQAVPSARPRPR